MACLLTSRSSGAPAQCTYMRCKGTRAAGGGSCLKGTATVRQTDLSRLGAVVIPYDSALTAGHASDHDSWADLTDRKKSQRCAHSGNWQQENMYVGLGFPSIASRAHNTNENLLGTKCPGMQHSVASQAGRASAFNIMEGISAFIAAGDMG